MSIVLDRFVTIITDLSEHIRSIETFSFNRSIDDGSCDVVGGGDDDGDNNSNNISHYH